MAKAAETTTAAPAQDAPAAAPTVETVEARWDPAEVARRQNARLADIEIIRSFEDRRHLGQWYGEPFQRFPELKNWHFFRCGLRDDASADAMAWRFKQDGWDVMPRTIRCRGFEGDGERMLVVGCTPEVYRNMSDDKKRRALGPRAAQQDWKKGLRELTEQGMDVSIKGSEGSGSLDDYAEAQRTARG